MKRYLAAILYADVYGYSRLTEKDEEATLNRLHDAMALFNELISAHEGTIRNTAGDAVLAQFESVVSAMASAIEFQSQMAQINHNLEIENRFEFRIGLHIGEVAYDRGDMFGEDVNLTARVQDLAEPGGITFTSAVYAQIKDRISKSFHDTGYHKLKNISESIQIFSIGKEDITESSHPTAFLTTRLKDQPLFDLEPGQMTRSPVATGGCLCEHIRFEVTGEPVGTGFCHCNICKKAIGAPVNAWVAFFDRDVTFLDSHPQQYQSSDIAERGFCPKCGTSLSYRMLKPEISDFVVLCIGSMDKPEDYPPVWHGGTECQLLWLELHDKLPRMHSDESPSLVKAWDSVGRANPEDWKPRKPPIE
jgi:adenylate cyclase